MAKSSRGKSNPPDDLAEIAIALQCEPPKGSLERLAQYAALMQRWNRRKRIIGSRDPADIVGVHLADCLALAGRLQITARSGQTLLDVGSGAGLPGLALSLLVTDLKVSLCEVSEKRVAFLHYARRALGAPVEILHEDVHVLAQQASRFDHVVSRAVFEPAQWIEIGQSCVATDGSIWCMVTDRQQKLCNLPGEAFQYMVSGERQRVLLRVPAPNPL